GGTVLGGGGARSGAGGGGHTYHVQTDAQAPSGAADRPGVSHPRTPARQSPARLVPARRWAFGWHGNYHGRGAARPDEGRVGTGGTELSWWDRYARAPRRRARPAASATTSREIG